MIFRIFYGNSCTDISDYSIKKTLTIGSGKGDTVQIEGTSLLKSHVTITKKKGEWVLVAKEKVFFQGEWRPSAPVKIGSVFGIDKRYNVSIFVIEEFLEKPLILDVSDRAAVTVGNEGSNDIVIKSRFVSKRHLCLRRHTDHFILSDEGSSNGTYVNGKAVTYTELSPGDCLIFGDAKMVYTGRTLEVYYAKERILASGFGEATRDYNIPVEFTRSPRLKAELPIGKIEIEAPPVISGKPEINWISTIVPAMTTVGISVAMVTITNNYMMLLYTLPMTVVGFILSIVNYRRGNKKYAKKNEQRKELYIQYLNSVVENIQKNQREQLHAMELSNPPTKECVVLARKLDRSLWQRRPTDADFLSVRVGSGSVAPSFEIEAPKSGLSLEKDDLRECAREVCKKYAIIEGAPINCSIMKEHVCGIVGSRADSLNLISNMIIQLAAQHSYNELKLILICRNDDLHNINWVTKLPHSKSEDTGRSYVVASKVETLDLLKSFTEILKIRQMEMVAEDNYGDSPICIPFYLFIFLEPAFLEKGNPINQYLFKSNNLYVGSIIAVNDVSQLPQECNEIISLKGSTGNMYCKENMTANCEFSLDACEAHDREEFGEALKKVRCDEMMAKKVLPKSYSFFDMLCINNVMEIDLAKNWRSNNTVDSIATPLGIKENGELFELDIHEKAHGPHGIIAGTTGSGKSEILISFILSMALKYHPYEVGFVIIDFKGGGMVNRLEGLPHLIGAITDLDGGGLERSLASIKAEVDKRKRIFAESKLKDNSISEYIRKFRSGEVKVPLPHLIIIVDEFAELKQNQPEFMKELVSISRIGRSLGIHLILATQQPGGQVSGEIWTNSRFQISLRAASAEDSNEVIKSPLAFSIREPGRAYVRVGNNEIFELIQSAYSGGKDKDGTFQFESVIKYIAEYCKVANIKPLPSIYLPPLSDVIDYSMHPVPPSPSDILTCVGRYDDPSHQAQGDLVLDLSGANTIIVGSPQQGKTNLLQTILRDVSQRYGPDRVNFYILDFGSMILRNFSGLNHVGGVVTAYEEEKLENLFKLLNGQLEIRRKIFLARHVSSYAAYQEAGFTDLPQIILIIDNMTVFQELYPDRSEDLISLCREGITAGITVIVANSQTSGLSYKYLTNFARRVALYCNDTGEYSALFEKNRKTIPSIPGRVMTEVNGELAEGQIFLSFKGQREIDRVNDILGFVQCCATESGSVRAQPIPMVPEIVTLEILKEMGLDTAAKEWRVPIGLDFANMELMQLDLTRLGGLAISGGEGSGKTNFLLQVVSAIQRDIFDNETAVYIADGDRSLQDIYGLGCVERVTSSVAEAEVMVNDVYAKLMERKQTAILGQEPEDNEALLMLVLSGDDMVSALLHNIKLGDKLVAIIKDLRKYKGLVLIDDVENTPINYSSPQVLKTLKEIHGFFAFEAIGNINLLDIPIKYLKAYSKEMKPGDGFSFVGGRIRRVRTIKYENCS